MRYVAIVVLSMNTVTLLPIFVVIITPPIDVTTVEMLLVHHVVMMGPVIILH